MVLVPVYSDFSCCLTTHYWLGLSLDIFLTLSWSWSQLATWPCFCLISPVWPWFVSRTYFCYWLLTCTWPQLASWPYYCYWLPTCLWPLLGSWPCLLFQLSVFDLGSTSRPLLPTYLHQVLATLPSRSAFWVLPCSSMLQVPKLPTTAPFMGVGGTSFCCICHYLHRPSLVTIIYCPGLLHSCYPEPPILTFRCVCMRAVREALSPLWPPPWYVALA